MAFLVSHVVYTDRFLKKNPGVGNGQEFLLGVLFPDIQKVSNVTREQTHNKFRELDLKFEGLSSFEAGWKFHVWCDLRRNEIIRDCGFVDIIKSKKYNYFSYFLLEDQIIWEKYGNWETLSLFLRNAPFRDLFEELSNEDWTFWYEAVADFISEKPNKNSIAKILRKTPNLAGKVEKITAEIEELEKDKKMVEFLKGIHLKII